MIDRTGVVKSHRGHMSTVNLKAATEKSRGVERTSCTLQRGTGPLRSKKSLSPIRDFKSALGVHEHVPVSET